MRYIRFSVELPLSIEQTFAGQQYMNYILDFDILKSRKENLNYRNNGQQKVLFLNDNLPQLIKDMLTGATLEIQQNITLKQKSFSTNLSCHNFPGFFCEIETENQNGPYQNTKKSDPYQSIEIDAIKSNLEYFQHYNETINQRISSNLKIQVLENWKQEKQQFTTVVNEVSLQMQYGEAQQILENEIIESLRKFFIYYYKSLLITYNKWSSMSLQQIADKQIALVKRTNKKEINPKYIYSQIVQNYDQITQKTNFLEVRNRFNKILNQSVSDISVIQNRNQQQQQFDSQSQFSYRVSLNRPQQQQTRFDSESRRQKDTQFLTQKQLQNTPNIGIQKNIIRKKTGQILKRGDGPIDYNWNQRYLVLDCQTLMYYKSYDDKLPRGFIVLETCKVSEIEEFEDRKYTFYIESVNPPKKWYFSGNSREETESWINEIQKAINTNPEEEFQSQQKKQIPLKKVDETALIQKNLQTDNFPDSVQKYRLIIEDLDNQLKQNQSWQPIKYKNGVKIYKSTEQQQSTLLKSKSSLKLKLIQVFAAALISLVLAQTTNLYIGLISGLVIFIVFQQIVLKKKPLTTNELKIAAQAFVEEKPINIFNNLKKSSFKQKIDFNLISQSTLEKTDENFTKTCKFLYDFQENQQNPAKKTKNSQNSLEFSCKKTHFVHKSQKMYIIFENSLQNTPKTPQNLNLLEIFIIQKSKSKSKSNHSEILFYSSLESSLFSSQNCEKLLTKRAQQLSILREIINDDEIQQNNIRMQRQLLSQNQNGNGNQSKSNQNNNDFHNKDLNMLFELPEHLIQSCEDQIQLIDALKEKKHPQGVKRKEIEERKPGYKRLKEGGIGCFNKQEIASQDGIVLDLLKSAGRNLLEGKNIVSISLPVRIFEPRSTLERICDNWAFMPIYLQKASRTTDALERFKLTISFVVAGLYNNCKQMKPFNPILGETFQGFFADGTKIDIEHTSHHPPVSHFFVQDKEKKYAFYGHYEYKANLKGKCMIGRQQGPQTVKFADGQTITWSYPQQRLSGVIYGTRVLEWLGHIEFVDETYNFKCKLQFQEEAGLFSSNKQPTDYFEGNIIKNDNPEEIYGRMKGSWMDYLEFDGVRYWDLGIIDPVKLIHTQGPLHSDCRYREDLIYLAKKDVSLSQEWKIKLEILQRKDRADRKTHKDKLQQQAQ